MNLFSTRNLAFYIRENKIKYIYAQRNKKSITILKKGTILFDPKFVKDNMLVDCDEVVRTLKNFMLTEQIQEKKVYLSLSDPSIILRISKVPFMPPSELRAYFDLEITHLFPVNAEDALYDYKILSKVEETEQISYNALLISIPKRLKENYAAIFRKAGLKLLVFDVYPNAMGRVFGKLSHQDIAVVDVNASRMDFIIMSGGNLFMYSNVTLDGSLENMEVTHMDIHMLLETFGEAETLFSQLTGFIRSYSGFFSSRKFGKNIDAIYILGDITKFQGVCDYFQGIFNIPVHMGLPEIYQILDGKKETLSDYTGNISLFLREG